VRGAHPALTLNFELFGTEAWEPEQNEFPPNRHLFVLELIQPADKTIM
jgi:hypothetical protein